MSNIINLLITNLKIDDDKSELSVDDHLSNNDHIFNFDK